MNTKNLLVDKDQSHIKKSSSSLCWYVQIWF